MKFYHLIGITLLALSGGAQAVELSSYPNAQLLQQDDIANSIAIAHAAAVRKLGQDINSENMLLLNAARQQISVYQLPRGHSPQFAEQWYQQQLPADAQILFACSGRACGSDALWANHIFADHRLIGDVDSQRYFIASYQQQASTIHIIFYAITRLTRISMARLQIIYSQ